MQLHLVGGKEALALEGGDDEVAGVNRQVGDVADRAGTGSFRGPKGLANEVRDVGFAVLA